MAWADSVFRDGTPFTKPAPGARSNPAVAVRAVGAVATAAGTSGAMSATRPACRPDDEGWGRGERPAIRVSWHDANTYLGWLSRKSGKRYRFVSESEWEYAARAGTTTARFWGEDADRGCGYANVHDRTSKRENKFGGTHHECDDGYAQTAPVGSFTANEFGVHDMLGNVWEWVGDCWNDSYRGAPSDGSAWSSRNCKWRILRGGSWSNGAWADRAAYRGRVSTAVVIYTRYQVNGIGFRVARTLD